MMDTKDGLTIDDFVYHAPTRKFIFILTGTAWRKSGVDVALPPVDEMPASAWLVRNRSVWRRPKR